MPIQDPTLSDMIQDALDNGVTYRELEARATDPETGRTASRSVFFDTLSGKLDRVPYDYHLRAMAAALSVPYEQVRKAAIRQWLPGGDAPSEQPVADREQMSHDLLELRNQLTAALDYINRIDKAPKRAKRPKSA